MRRVTRASFGAWAARGVIAAGAAVRLPPFEVTGSSATWSGTLRDRESGREEAAKIELECGQ